MKKVAIWLGIFGFVASSMCLSGCNAKQEDVIQRTDRTKRASTEVEAGQNTESMQLVE